MATKGWSMGALSKALKSLAFWDPSDAYKAAYPVGTVLIFDNQTNPNNAFPGTTWVQVVHGRTTRSAKTLAEIGTERGADDGTLTMINMPEHSHSWSGTIASVDLGNKAMSSSGNHNHTFSLAVASAGAHTHGAKYHNANPAFDGGGSNSRTWDIGQSHNTESSMIGSSGAHTHTISLTTGGMSVGHTHATVVGSHAHNVSGTVGNTGSGTSFNYTNTCHMYGTWKRTA